MRAGVLRGVVAGLYQKLQDVGAISLGVCTVCRVVVRTAAVTERQA